MKKHSFGVNFEAYFLGPKGENSDFYQRLLLEAFQDHVNWRKAFHFEEDTDFISGEDKEQEDFKESLKKIEATLDNLRERLKKNQPFFSPRYIGHMNWEVMAAPVIAFFTAALYNPNNVARAGSTGTSELELDVGKDFVKLFGFDEEQGWGHICTGGTIANMEALWIARNMKVIPLVLQEILMMKTFKNNDIDKVTLQTGREVDLKKLTEKELLSSFNPLEILDLKEAVTNNLKNKFDKNDIDDAFDEISVQKRGLIWKGNGVDTGVIFLPETKHYSLKKAIDLLGIGTQNIEFVPVNDKYRMDMSKLEEMIFKVKRPILAVVGVAGSTEESSVDEIHKMVEIRERLHKEKAKSFHLHVDAAYGGYVRSLFLDEDGTFMDKGQLDVKLKELKIIGDKDVRQYASWPHDEVFKAFEAMSHADTITVDPHKLGYVLYPAGGIAMRDKRMRETIQTFAPYVFKKPKTGEPDTLIGAYILEGSKPGAAAAAVWTAHRIMPLNINGYGKLIGETIDGAQALWYGLDKATPFDVEKGIQIEVHPIVKPDINIVNYVFNFTSNTDLEKMNKLTEFIATNILGPIPDKGQTILDKKYIVSDTDFSYEEYGDSPLQFLKKIAFAAEEWERIHKVKIVRSVIMSPYLTPDYVDENYVANYVSYLKEQIKENRTQIRKIYDGEEI